MKITVYVEVECDYCGEILTFNLEDLLDETAGEGMDWHAIEQAAWNRAVDEHGWQSRQLEKHAGFGFGETAGVCSDCIADGA